MRLDYILAVADLNGDGRDDIVAGGREDAHDARPEDRHDTTALAVFLGRRNGTFRHAPELVDGAIEAREPVVVAVDFNADQQIDLAVFDKGVYVDAESVGYGNPPQLWLSDNDGVLRYSDTFADAVRAEHALRPPTGKGLSGPADLYIKLAAAGDIDKDGDLDLWVESTGGKNVVSHFMVNNGDETFTIERDRATHPVFRNSPPDYWRHVGHTFLDIDNDGDLDLALGHLRGTRPERATSVSMVVVNDGTGYYPRRIILPHPSFNEGYTAVQFMTHFDFNDDGFEDLLLVHAREDGPEGLPSYTGRYLQALINDGGESFVDETPTWIRNQHVTEQVYYSNGDLLYNFADPRMLDIDRDGCKDIVMANAFNPIRRETPIFYLNNGSGQFRALRPDEMFVGMGWDGKYATPADVNGDGLADLVIPQRILGPDDDYGTEDDATRFLTLLNRTPLRPTRCSDVRETLSKIMEALGGR